MIKKIIKKIKPKNKKEIISIDKEILSSNQEKLIQNVLSLSKKKVFDIMQSKHTILPINKNLTLEEALISSRDNIHSRYPVYSETKFNVIGIVYLKDMIKEYFIDKTKKINEIMEPVSIISPSISIDCLIEKILNDKKQLILVGNEYGGFQGTVTIEDIIEEIIGNFSEENNINTPYNFEYKIINNAIHTNAQNSIENLERLLDLKFENLKSKTINGLIVELLGRIPVKHEIIHEPNSKLNFEVLSANEKTVKNVAIYGRSIDKINKNAQ